MAKKKKGSVKEVLNQIPDKELRKFVSKELGIQEVLDDFMQEFKSYFLQGDRGEAYINQINSAFLNADEEYGYIPFREQAKLLRVVEDAAEAATEFREKGNYQAAIDIYFTILEHGIDAVNYSDDSMGYIGSIMHTGIQGLCALADPEVCTLDKESRHAMMNRCLTHIKKKTFDGWDWHTDMYDFFIALANCEQEYETIMHCLDGDEYMKKSYYGDVLLNMKRALISKWKGTDEAHEFLLSNLQVTEFREKAIGEALSAIDFQQAYKLTLDGIKQDEKERPGIIPKWNHWMLRIAQKENNYELTVKYASLLYLHPWSEQGDFFKVLKDTVPPDQWVDFAEGLAKQAISMGYMDKYASLCMREEWYDRLMDYVRKEKSIHTLEHYESYLLKDYREEIIAMYVAYANRLLTHSYTRNRKTYQEMCRYFKHAIKIGGHDAVAEAIKVLKDKYKRSPALIEELSSIRL